MRVSKGLSAVIIMAVVVIASGVAIRFGLYTGKKELASGRFHNVAHKGSGRAAIYRLPDGKLALSFTDFRTDEGQDLQVYLISAPDAFENETVENSEYITVGRLQKAEGDQSYRLPDDLDLTRYRAVTIWSYRHRVNFTTAPLSLD